MAIVVLDLEWNGAFCKQTGGFFNEIIEIGAVRLNDDFTIADRFDAVIRPRMNRKLTRWVSELTGYTDEQIKGGTTFQAAMKSFCDFAGEAPTLLTWSTTDLLVLMENCRLYYGEDRIPAAAAYMDLQAYAQQRLQLSTSQQVGLSRFAEMLGIESEAFELHHAIDDSVLSAHILAKVYERESFTTAVRPMNEEFYRRLTFKPSIVKELDDPAVKKEKLIFHCPKCRKPLKETGQWRFFHNRFNAPLQCPVCRGEYYGRVQVRRTFDGPVTKRSLAPKKPKEPEEKKENT